MRSQVTFNKIDSLFVSLFYFLVILVIVLGHSLGLGGQDFRYFDAEPSPLLNSRNF